MNYAVRYYHLPENPCRIAGSMGKKDAEEMEIWIVDEFNKFIATVNKPGMKLAFEIMFWSGLRVGETIALTPADILPTKVIDVNKSLARIDGEDKFYDPKTAKSTQQVPIPDYLYDDIQTYINMHYGIKSNVKQIRVHDLRHSHASMLIELGHNILLISERLGHENVETTWKTYAHLYPNKQVQLAQEIGKHKNGIITVSQE
jgi:integrase